MKKFFEKIPIKRHHVKKASNEIAEIRLEASALAYSSLLSIIPFLVIVLACFQYLGGLEQFLPKAESILFSYMREATGSSASKYFRSALDGVDFRTLGISGGLVLMWTSIGLIRNIDYAFNRIWRIEIETPFYKRILLYSIVLVAVPVGLALFIGLKSVFFLNEGIHSFEHQFLFSIWIWLFIFSLYKIIPDTHVKIAPSLISSGLAAIGVATVQKSFLTISANVFRQNKIYGSLASVPIFLVWLLVIWYVVLIGVALCAFLQQKSSKKP
ncbi:MAG: YihY/virulence factor BrkB family protein [Pseudobdellovibrio sp.]